MNTIILSSTHNSEAVCDPLISISGYLTSSPVHSSLRRDLQSSSITSSGHLWDQVLAHIPRYSSSAIFKNESEKRKVDYSTGEKQRRDALIQLLQSWREDDEQEQQETLEYLKRTLDEDRFSDRKLFP